MMNIDFPLILVIVVLGSGAIWLLDTLLLAGGRQSRRQELAARFPGHEEEGSKAAHAFSEACLAEAAEPAVVEYAALILSCIGGRIGIAFVFIRAFPDPLVLYGAYPRGRRLHFGE